MDLISQKQMQYGPKVHINNTNEAIQSSVNSKHENSEMPVAEVSQGTSHIYPRHVLSKMWAHEASSIFLPFSGMSNWIFL